MHFHQHSRITEMAGKRCQCRNIAGTGKSTRDLSHVHTNLSTRRPLGHLAVLNIWIWKALSKLPLCNLLRDMKPECCRTNQSSKHISIVSQLHGFYSPRFRRCNNTAILRPCNAHSFCAIGLERLQHQVIDILV